jgi:serine protease AprX
MTAGAPHVRADDIITTYSSRGPSFGDHVLKPDMVAPGNRIISTLADGAAMADLLPDAVVAPDRIELSGSSLAAGVVSGTAALLFERNPLLTNDQIKTILMQSADDVEGESPFAVGAGYLQAVRAIAMTGPFVPVRFNSASPIVHRGEKEGMFYLADPTVVRGESNLWGETALWTDSVLGNGD